jgi:BlaI family transcriptional regulator, penicillinase repressor
MSPGKLPELHPRERQIIEVLYRHGKLAVSEVLDHMTDPPSYSTVRTLLRRLEEKGVVTHEEDGQRYLYRATVSRERARRSALQRLTRTFFNDSPFKVAAAVLGEAAEELTAAELDELSALLERARRKGE